MKYLIFFKLAAIVRYSCIIFQEAFLDLFIAMRYNLPGGGFPFMSRPAAPHFDRSDYSSGVVLIDDDPLVHMVWRHSARQFGIQLKCFSNPRNFLSEFRSGRDSWSGRPRIYPRIYIDSQLNAEDRGEILAKRLYENGFREIFLATGETISDLSPYPWIKGVFGKDPPWASKS